MCFSQAAKGKRRSFFDLSEAEISHWLQKIFHFGILASADDGNHFYVFSKTEKEFLVKMSRR